MAHLPEDIQRIMDNVSQGHSQMAVPHIRFPLPPSRILTTEVRNVVRSVNMFWDYSKSHKSFLEEVRTQCRRQNVVLPHGDDLEILIKILGLPLDVFEAATGGNCGPASVIHQLEALPDLSEAETNCLRAYPQNDKQRMLRFLVSKEMLFSKEDHIQQYREAYQTHDKNASLVKGRKEKDRWPSYEAMWTEMGKDTVYVEEGFWQGAALVLERDVHLVDLGAHPKKPFQTFSGNRFNQHQLQEDKKPIFIGYMPPDHYLSLQVQPYASPTMLDIVRHHKLLQQQTLVQGQQEDNVPVVVFIDPLTGIVRHNIKPG